MGSVRGSSRILPYPLPPPPHPPLKTNLDTQDPTRNVAQHCPSLCTALLTVPRHLHLRPHKHCCQKLLDFLYCLGIKGKTVCPWSAQMQFSYKYLCSQLVEPTDVKRGKVWGEQQQQRQDEGFGSKEVRCPSKKCHGKGSPDVESVHPPGLSVLSTSLRE